MSSLASYLFMLPHLIRTLFRKPATVSFPHGPLELPEGYPGYVVVEIDKCGGCGLCARDCPSQALQVERPSKGEVRMTHRFDRCLNCGQCELSCRQGAIRLAPFFKVAAASRDGLTQQWHKHPHSEG